MKDEVTANTGSCVQNLGRCVDINLYLRLRKTRRQARDIRAHVQEVTELCAEESGHVSLEALREWRQWALAQADRIDPVVSGRFRESMREADD